MNRDTEFTINPDTGELMVHLHGVDATGWDECQRLLEADLGKAVRLDKRVKPHTAQQTVHVGGHSH